MLSWNPTGLMATGLDQPEETLRLLRNAPASVVQTMDLDGTPVRACGGMSYHAAGAAMAEALLTEGRTDFGCVGSGLDRDIVDPDRGEDTVAQRIASPLRIDLCL